MAHQAALDALLTETLAVLLQAGLITLTRVARDGTRDRCGLHRVRVRGLHKVLCVALWMAVTHNLLRWGGAGAGGGGEARRLRPRDPPLAADPQRSGKKRVGGSAAAQGPQLRALRLVLPRR